MKLPTYSQTKLDERFTLNFGTPGCKVRIWRKIFIQLKFSIHLSYLLEEKKTSAFVL